MERVEIQATSHFTDFKVGSVSRKQRILVDSVTADRLEALGLVKILRPQTATASMPKQTAPLVAGGGESSASSQAAQASPSKTADSSSDSPSGESSPSTTPGNSAPTLTPSTPATESGGTATTPRSKLSLSGKGGAKTRAQRKDTD